MSSQAVSSRKAASSIILDENRESWLVQLIVPIFNEGENVVRLYRRLIEERIPFDALTYVYDCADDNSLPYLEQLARTDSRVKSEQNQHGCGVIKALRWGFAHCEPGPVIVLMGDSSDKLSVIPDMLSAWYNGATIVSPSRYMKGGKQHGGPPLKTFLSTVAGRFLGLCGFPTSDATNNFKLYDGRWIRRQAIESRGGFEIALELCYKCFKSGGVITELPTEWWDRTAGESRFKLWRWLPRYLHWYLRLLWEVAKRKILPRPAPAER